MLQQGTTALLWGLPGSTKTTHAIDWWARLSFGLDWCDAKVTKGITFYLVLEDLAGFRARVDAWQEHNEMELPPWALWWDGGFDFSDECTAAVRTAMEAAQREHGLPVVLITIDPIMAAYGEGTALDEQDFRQRLTAIESMMAPFPEATALALQHAGWEGKHELGSIIQRALTATSIRATANADTAQLTIVRQKNDEEGRTLTFQKQSLGGKGKLVMVPATISKKNAASLSGQNRIAYDALVRAIDDGNQAGTTQPPLPKSGQISLSERCPVDAWRGEYERMRSDGSDTTPDSMRRAFDRARNSLKKAGVVSFYNNLAWVIWDTPDKPDMGSDK